MFIIFYVESRYIYKKIQIGNDLDFYFLLGGTNRIWTDDFRALQALAIDHSAMVPKEWRNDLIIGKNQILQERVFAYTWRCILYYPLCARTLFFVSISLLRRPLDWFDHWYLLEFCFQVCSIELSLRMKNICLNDEDLNISVHRSFSR